MEAGAFSALGRDFLGLLLLPTLGVLGLMDRRAIPVLRWTLVLWIVLGGLALATGNTWTWNPERFLRLWALGVGLGAAFLAIAVARRDRRVRPWLRVALALLTLAAFARALLVFLGRHA